MKNHSYLTVLFALAIPCYASANEPATSIAVGGFVEAYGVYAAQDEPAGSTRKFDLRKYTELHLIGEQALTRDVKAGMRVELSVDRADGTSSVQESYLYLEAPFGRFNIGEEDGAAFLLQVAAPGADELIDGVRPHISAFGPAIGGGLNYAHDDFEYANKVTYLTPKFEGLQFGLSYTPSGNAPDTASFAPALSDDNPAPRVDDGWEAAVKHVGALHGVEIATGAGYSRASAEDGAGEPLWTWNVGMTASLSGFELGAAFVMSNGALNETESLAIGTGYKMGPGRIGASFLRQNGGGPANDNLIERWTLGGTYEWGPGLTLRGGVQMQMAEDTTSNETDGTQLLLGTMVSF